MIENWIPTSGEVWAVLHARHKLRAYSSFSNPEGDSHLGNGKPEMVTAYCFDGADAPLIKARTTWEKGEKSYDRVNEKHEYWINAPLEDRG